MLCADFESYKDTQVEVSNAYLDIKRWSRMSVLNVSRIGKFSSDRAIREYCADIWHIEPCRVGIDGC